MSDAVDGDNSPRYPPRLTLPLTPLSRERVIILSLLNLLLPRRGPGRTAVATEVGPLNPFDGEKAGNKKRGWLLWQDGYPFSRGVVEASPGVA